MNIDFEIGSKEMLVAAVLTPIVYAAIRRLKIKYDEEICKKKLKWGDIWPA